MDYQNNKNGVGDIVSAREVYKLINDTRLELSGHILRLETKFDTLEAGRVSALEKQITEMKAEQEPVKRLVYGLVSVVLLGVVGALLSLILINN